MSVFSKFSYNLVEHCEINLGSCDQHFRKTLFIDFRKRGKGETERGGEREKGRFAVLLTYAFSSSADSGMCPDQGLNP